MAHRPTEPGVERLDRVRCVHDLSELDRELEERSELGPRGLLNSPGIRGGSLSWNGDEGYEIKSEVVAWSSVYG